MRSESQDSRLSPELELVLLCLRSHRDTAGESRLRALLAGPLDWDELTATVVPHQVLPSFYRRIQSVAPDCLPARLRSYFECRTRGFAKKNMLFFAEMLRLMAAFEAEGILLIPYKGIVQGWMAYQDLGVRACSDLDFAVRQRDIPRAAELLKARGYESWLQPKELRLSEEEQYPGQYAFHRADLELLVELHTERTLRYFPVSLDFDALERRLQTIEIGGRAVRTFSREDTLVLLCVHGAKHFWARLNWISDIARLGGDAQGFDWASLEATAADMKCTRSVLLGLFIAHEMLGARIPEMVLSRARRDRNVILLASQVREEFVQKEESPRGIFQRALFRIRTRDRFGDGLRHVWRLSTRPTERDWGYLAGATGRSSLSSALRRPWRLLRQYGWRLTPEPRRDLAIFEPTTVADVDRLIEFAGLGPDDVLYDLGCGDGRVVIRAAERRGSRGVGIDVDPRRIAESRANARSSGVEDRVRFVLQDAKEADLSDATVVFLFLGVAGNLRLLPSLQKQLRPGTRIISRIYSIPGWDAEAREEPPAGDLSRKLLYRWRVGSSPGNRALPVPEAAAHMDRIAETKRRSA
ncbi:MAG: nucleotidyltransferase family protein [Candidatus Acidiferrales bacterium]